MEEQNTNTMRSFMTSDYGDGKLTKEKELNSSMSIQTTSGDEYTRKINALGGSTDNA